MRTIMSVVVGVLLLSGRRVGRGARATFERRRVNRLPSAVTSKS